MRTDKNKATKLRKSGKSYGEIEKQLGVPKSTLTSWFRKENWSKSIKKRLSFIAIKNASKRMKIMSQKKKRERTKLYQSTKQLAQKQFRKISQEKLFLCGLVIYWGEGDSKLENGVIRVTNTDPVMLKLFHTFLKKYFPEISHKTKAYLILYPDLVDEKCKKFWSKKIGIKQNRFIKSQYIQGRHPTKRLDYGVCTITITSRAYKEKIIVWLELFRKEILKMRV
jgi:hypothetical protein